MNSKTVEIDATGLKRHIIKCGETLGQLAAAVGVSAASMSRYLQKGVMPKVAYICILQHYNIADEGRFLKTTAVTVQQAREDNAAVLAAIGKCEERLAFINSNICELLAAVADLTKAMSDFVEAMK